MLRIVHPPSDCSGNSKVFPKKADEVHLQAHDGEHSTLGNILILGDSKYVSPYSLACISYNIIDTYRAFRDSEVCSATDL